MYRRTAHNNFEDGYHEDREEMVEFWADLNNTRSFPGGRSSRGRLGRLEAADLKLGDKIQLVGDDLFVTNTDRLKKGIEMGVTIPY